MVNSSRLNSIKNYLRRFAAAALCAVGLAATFTGCSPDVFSKDHQDAYVDKAQVGYRKINPDCANLNLSSAHLTAPVYRQLLDCFNAYGALDPLVALTRKLTDADIETLLTVLNRAVLDDPKALFRLDATFRDLQAAKQLDPAFQSFGDFLAQPKPLVGALRWALRAEQTSDSDRGHLSPFVLKLMEHWGGSLDAEHFSGTVDQALDLISLPAWKELVARMGADQAPTSTETSRLAMLQALRAYAQEVKAGETVDVGEKVLRQWSSGQLAALLKVGMQPDLPTAISRATSIVTALSASGGGDWVKLSNLVRQLHDPIQCWGGVASIAHPYRQALHELFSIPDTELAASMVRGHPLQLAGAGAFCNFPAGFSDNYAVITRLAETSALLPSRQWLEWLDQPGDLDTLVDAFSAASPVQMNGILRFVPLVVEGSARGIWDDFLLSMQGFGDRDPLRAFVTDFMGEPYQFFLAELASRDASSWSDLWDATQGWRDAKTPPAWIPLLRSMRSIYFVNDAHPFLDFTKDWIGHAQANEAVWLAFGRAAQNPEFEAALQLGADMAKDGRLHQLMGFGLDIFRKFSNSAGVSAPRATVEPVWQSARRHSWVAADLVALPLNRHSVQTDAVDNVCRNVGPEFDWLDTKNTGYGAKLDQTLACLAGDVSEHAGLLNAIASMRNDRVGEGPSSFDYILGWVGDFRPQGVLARDWAAKALDWIDQGKLFRSLQGVDLFVRQGVGSGSVSRPWLSLLGTVLGPAAESQSAFGHWLNYVGTWFERAEFGAVLTALEGSLRRETPVITKATPDESRLETHFRQSIRNRECILDPTALENRVHEAMTERRFAASNGELVDGYYRRGWTRPELHAVMKPIVDAVADSNSGVAEALVNVLKYFTLPDGKPPGLGLHYHRDDLLKFLQDRAVNDRVVLNFPPGSKSGDEVRVRAINTLDAFEILVLNADIHYILPGNLGLNYLQKFALAWGDENSDVWPAEAGPHPQTLAQAYADMEGTLKTYENLAGYPTLPYCAPAGDADDVPNDGIVIPKTFISGVPDWVVPHDIKARLFNLRQVMDLIADNLPNSGKPAAGGLKVIRDLFFELYKATPPDARNAEAGERNHLSLVAAAARMGILRQPGRLLRDSPRVTNDAAALSALSDGDREEYRRMVEFFRGLTAPAIGDQAIGLERELLQTPGGYKQFWAIVDAIWDVGHEGGAIAANLRSAVYSLLGIAARWDAVDPAVAAVREIRSHHEQFITEHARDLINLISAAPVEAQLRAWSGDADETRVTPLAILLKDILSDRTRAVDLVTLFKVVDLNPSALANWHQGVDGFSEYVNSSAADNLGMPALGRDLLAMFEHALGEDRDADFLRRFIARRLKRVGTDGADNPGDLEAWLQLAARHPELTQIQLEALFQELAGSDFVSLMQRSRAYLDLVPDPSLPIARQ